MLFDIVVVVIHNIMVILLVDFPVNINVPVVFMSLLSSLPSFQSYHDHRHR